MQEYSYKTLANGIRIVHKPSVNMVAHCGIMINTGSRDETEKEHGIAHFLEHVIFKGTKHRKAFHILSRLENVGGEINAYTTKEETCIYGSFVNKYFERAIELFHDIVFNSIFPEKELDKEKDVIIDEIHSYEETPSEDIFDKYEELLYKGHAIGRNILGTPRNVKKFSSKDIIKFIANNYHTDQIVICAVGDIKFEKLVRTVEKYFFDIPANLRSDKRIPYSGYKPFETTLRKKTQLTHCIIGNVAYGAADEKKTALVLLNNLLGGPGMNSRMNLAIREKYGFCYSLESHYVPFSDTGLFAIYLGTDRGFVDKTIMLIHKELDKLRTKKLGVLQLHRAKQQLIGQIAIAQESNLNEMMAMGKSLLLFDKVDSLETINTKIEALNSDKLIEVANEIFAESKQSMLVYTSKK